MFLLHVTVVWWAVAVFITCDRCLVSRSCLSYLWPLSGEPYMFVLPVTVVWWAVAAFYYSTCGLWPWSGESEMFVLPVTVVWWAVDVCITCDRCLVNRIDVCITCDRCLVNRKDVCITCDRCLVSHRCIRRPCCRSCPGLWSWSCVQDGGTGSPVNIYTFQD